MENLYKCWFLEHPVTKQLTHKIALNLEASESQTLVVVLKSPTLMRVVNMLSIVKITQGNTYTVKDIATGKR